jgi:hypothetical protein
LSCVEEYVKITETCETLKHGSQFYVMQHLCGIVITF